MKKAFTVGQQRCCHHSEKVQAASTDTSQECQWKGKIPISENGEKERKAYHHSGGFGLEEGMYIRPAGKIKAGEQNPAGS